MATSKKGEDLVKKAVTPKITVKAHPKYEKGQQFENSPFPVSVDRDGNRKVIPSEMLDFKYNGNSTYHAAGYIESMHTILAESLSARGKGEIIGETKKAKVPKKFAAAKDATD